MKGMAAAVERLTRALRAEEKITLYGDYDVDGVCSTSLLYLFLRELGAPPGHVHPPPAGRGLRPQPRRRWSASPRTARACW